MDQRSMIGLLLIFIVSYTWMAIRQPQLQPPAEAIVETVDEAPLDVPVVDVAPEAAAEAMPATDDLPVETVAWRACDATMELTTDGGAIQRILLDNHLAHYNTKPLYTWLYERVTGATDQGWSPWGAPPDNERILDGDGRALAVGSGAFDTQPTRMTIAQRSGDRIRFEGRDASGLAVSQTYTEVKADDGCTIALDVSWSNEGTSSSAGPLWVSMHGPASSGGSAMTARYQSLKQPTAFVDDGLVYGGPTGKGCVSEGTQLEADRPTIDVEGSPSWFGLSDRYFGLYAIPNADADADLRLTRLAHADEPMDGAHLLMDAALAPGGRHDASLTVYVGPNGVDELAAVDPQLAEVIDLGWFAFFGHPLLWLLRLFNGWVDNWGVSIVLLTLFVKILFFPMTQRSFRSMQKMQKIQPEMQALREKYKDNPQEMNKRVFELMTTNKVNPAAGCFPMLIQMPVWIALYNVLLTSVDLYHTEFMYLRDLTEPDPYLVLPVLVMVLMFLQQRFSMPANMDPAQQQIMKFMPLFFGLMFFAFPSGLAVYVFVNMVLSILQQWWIKRGLDSEDLVPA